MHCLFDHGSKHNPPINMIRVTHWPRTHLQLCLQPAQLLLAGPPSERDKAPLGADQPSGLVLVLRVIMLTLNE